MKITCWNKQYVDQLDIISKEISEEMSTEELKQLFFSHGFILGPYISLRAIGEDISGHSIVINKTKIGRLHRYSLSEEAIVNQTITDTMNKLKNQ